ncbi:MAG: crossover junction endodeoxyribonuclease RuvC, partial [Planctomycetota bacterium]
IDRLLDLLKPEVVVVEEAYAGRNVQSALRIGEGRGVALSCAAVRGAQIRQFPPAVAKKAVCGNGRASKLQVAAMIRVLLGEGAASLPEDASDALALALAHVQENALADKLTGRLKSHT